MGTKKRLQCLAPDHKDKSKSISIQPKYSKIMNFLNTPM